MPKTIYRLEITPEQAQALLDSAAEGANGLQTVFTDPFEARHYSEGDKVAARAKHANALRAIDALRSAIRWENAIT